MRLGAQVAQGGEPRSCGDPAPGGARRGAGGMGRNDRSRGPPLGALGRGMTAGAVAELTEMATEAAVVTSRQPAGALGGAGGGGEL